MVRWEGGRGGEAVMGGPELVDRFQCAIRSRRSYCGPRTTCGPYRSRCGSAISTSASTIFTYARVKRTVGARTISCGMFRTIKGPVAMGRGLPTA